LQNDGFLAECFVHCLIFEEDKKFDDYHQEYSYLTENLIRLQSLVGPILEIAKTGNTLLLVDRIGSGEYLQQLIPNSLFVNGNTTMKERERIYELAANNDGLCIIATYGVAAVGIDIPRLYNVAMLEAGKSFIRIIQSIGRGLRLAKDKSYADIWDLSSTCKFSKKHAKERIKYYSHADYPYKDITGDSIDIIKYIDNHNKGVIK
jgi:superfamily II DNA or RNA helicase